MKSKFPKIMGILNATPDSFSDGGTHNSLNTAIEYGLKMIEQGADIIDVGGESTRPGAAEVSIEEEIERTANLIEGLKKENQDIEISIDTTKYAVAKAAIEAGADMINDISGLTFEPELAELASEYDKSLVLMHIQGNPRTMQANPTYHDLIMDVFTFLEKQIAFAKSKGVKNVYADVGIGFGKTVEHNWELLKKHDEFEKLGVPLLLGISRKSFIGKTFDIEIANERDFETGIIHSLLLGKNIEIIRVHNVELHSRIRDIYMKLK
jgi:dihydropteroate synthase